MATIGVGFGSRWWTRWPTRVSLHQSGNYWPLVSSLDIAPGGRTLTATGWHREITVWSLEDGRKAASYAPPAGGCYLVGEFSSDGRTLAAGWLREESNRTRIFGFDLIDTASGRVRASVPSWSGVRFGCAFLGNEVIRVIINDRGGGEAVDHDVATGRLVARRPISCAFPVGSIFVLSPDGRLMAQAPPVSSATAKKPTKPLILIWDLDRDREVARLPRGPLLPPMAFSNDQTSLAVGRNDGSIELWDYRARRLQATLQGHTPGFGVMELRFAPDGSTLVSVGRYSNPRPANLAMDLAIALRNRQEIVVMDLVVLDVATGRRLHNSRWEGSPAFTSDGRFLASTDGEIINVRKVPGQR